MKTIILPGYSLHNRDWAYEVKDYLKSDFEMVVHEWNHWRTNGRLSIKFEVKQILSEVGGSTVNFIAKSVGTRVLMSVIPKIVNQINKIVLCGIPIDPMGYGKPLTLLPPAKIVIFQNSQDPFMPAKAIRLYMRLLNPKIKVIDKPAKTHDYPYFDDFKKFLL